MLINGFKSIGKLLTKKYKHIDFSCNLLLRFSTLLLLLLLLQLLQLLLLLCAHTVVRMITPTARFKLIAVQYCNVPGGPERVGV